MTFAQRQRHELLDLMAELGPFAPTRCEGWQTQELAAHLWVREHKPAALPGIGVARFADYTARIQLEALHTIGYLPMLDQLRSLPLLWRPLDRLVNAAKFFLHHEDVLSANGRSQQLSHKEQDELWRPTLVLARRTQFRFGGRLVLTRTDTGATVTMGKGARPVNLHGLPSQLLTQLSGREADVRLTAEPDVLDAWSGAVDKL